MFVGVLYFILGFLAAALLGLMVFPAIWNRAVVLTKKRIESSVPLTLNEIQADKDQLRAEFAMSTRRLEISIEELQEKASRQMIEINRKRDELAKLAEESTNKVRSVEELDSRASELRTRLAEREDALDKTSRALDEARAKLEQRALELEALKERHEESRVDADSKRIELVAKQANLDDFADRLKDYMAEKKVLESEITVLKTRLESADDRDAASEERLSRLQKTNADLEEKLQRKERQVSDMRSNDRAENDTANALTAQLMEERKRATGLEAKLAKATLKMEAILSDASNENVRNAMAILETSKVDLNSTIKSLTAERDQLLKELNAFKLNEGLDWEQERKDNAVLRERINDLAAQVTSMTASIEGPGSPINSILEDGLKASKRVAKSAGKAVKGVETEGGLSPLAQRIKALQDAARQKQA